MALTRAQMRTRISRWLEDPQNIQWSTTEIDDFFNEEVLRFWYYVKKKNPHALPHTTVLYTWTADTLSVDLTGASLANTSVFDLYLVRQTPRIEAVSSTNRPVPVDRIAYEELGRNTSFSTWVLGNQIALGGSTAWMSGAGAGLRWALQDRTMYLDPPPAADIQLQLLFLKPFTPPAADGTDVLSGGWDRWERCVQWSVALDCLSRSSRKLDETLRMRAEEFALLDGWLTGREQDQATPAIQAGAR